MVVSNVDCVHRRTHLWRVTAPLGSHQLIPEHEQRSLAVAGSVAFWLMGRGHRTGSVPKLEESSNDWPVMPAARGGSRWAVAYKFACGIDRSGKPATTREPAVQSIGCYTWEAVPGLRAAAHPSQPGTASVQFDPCRMP